MELPLFHAEYAKPHYLFSITHLIKHNFCLKTTIPYPSSIYHYYSYHHIHPSQSNLSHPIKHSKTRSTISHVSHDRSTPHILNQSPNHHTLRVCSQVKIDTASSRQTILARSWNIDISIYFWHRDGLSNVFDFDVRVVDVGIIWDLDIWCTNAKHLMKYLYGKVIEERKNGEMGVAPMEIVRSIRESAVLVKSWRRTLLRYMALSCTLWMSINDFRIIRNNYGRDMSCWRT